MSITKYPHRAITNLTFVVVLLGVTASIMTADDVLNYYLAGAKAVFNSRNPIKTGISFSYTANTLYKQTDSHGHQGVVDTSSVTYFVSYGEVDSQLVIKGEASKFKYLDLSVPDIFRPEYLYSPFPNYTGGDEFAIGLDRLPSADSLPAGLIIIDPDRFVPKWLYLSYPIRPGLTRITRSFRFVEIEGLFFPDSVWVVGAKPGVFGSDHFRLETAISNITIYR